MFSVRAVYVSQFATSSPILQLATLISAVAAAGRKNNGNAELAEHLADLKKSHQGQPGARDRQVPGTTEKRTRRHPQPPSHAARFARRDDTWVKRLAWQTCIGLGILLIGFLARNADRITQRE